MSKLFFFTGNIFNFYTNCLLILKSLFILSHCNNRVLLVIIDFFAPEFTSASSLVSSDTFYSSSCNKTGFFFLQGTDCFIVFTVTQASFSLTPGVLSNRSSVSRDLNCE